LLSLHELRLNQRMRLMHGRVSSYKMWVYA